MKVIKILLIFAILFFTYRFWSQSQVGKNQIASLPSIFVRETPTPTTIPFQTISYQGVTYAVQYFQVSDPNKLILIPNFTEKLSSADLFEKYSCQAGINGGFYDTNDKPLGGFRTGDRIMKNPVSNRLIDGYLWADDKNIDITLNVPGENTIFMLQTGPVLMLSGKKTSLSIANDEYRRRSLALHTRNGLVLFMIIYDPESVYQGPLLAELPDLVEIIREKLLINVDSAINLDGGSASSYYSKSKILTELSSIGSFFCLK